MKGMTYEQAEILIDLIDARANLAIIKALPTTSAESAIYNTLVTRVREAEQKLLDSTL